MDSKKAREIMREHQSGFVKLNPRWCAIEKLIEDSEKLEQIEKIVERFKGQYDLTSSFDLMVEINEVLNG